MFEARSRINAWQGHWEVLSEGWIVTLTELHLINAANEAFQRTQTSKWSDFHFSLFLLWPCMRSKTCSHAITQCPGWIWQNNLSNMVNVCFVVGPKKTGTIFTERIAAKFSASFPDTTAPSFVFYSLEQNVDKETNVYGHFHCVILSFSQKFLKIIS